MSILKYANPLTYIKPAFKTAFYATLIGGAATAGWFANDFYRKEVSPVLDKNKETVDRIKEGTVELAGKGKQGYDALKKGYLRLKKELDERDNKKEEEKTIATLETLSMAVNK